MAAPDPVSARGPGARCERRCSARRARGRPRRRSRRAAARVARQGSGREDEAGEMGRDAGGSLDALVERLPAREDRDPAGAALAPVSPPTGYGWRSAARAETVACRTSLHTRSGIAGSRSCTIRADHGRRSASASVSAPSSSPPTRTRTRSAIFGRSTGRSCSNVLVRCRPGCRPQPLKLLVLQRRSSPTRPIPIGGVHRFASSTLSHPDQPTFRLRQPAPCRETTSSRAGESRAASTPAR